MPTVTHMSNETDDRLLALFAEAHETLPSAEFMQSFLAWIMPRVLATTAAVVHVVGEQSRPYGALIISPAGWAVSMLIGFLVLLRTGALGRGRRRSAVPLA
jgi:hypothetical protein